MSKELDDFLLRRSQAASAPARAAVKAAAAQGIQPDAAAQQAATARRYGVSPAVVAAAPELFKEEDAADEADRIITSAPRLGDWLAKRDFNAAMARDDLAPMSDTEKTIASRPPREGIISRILSIPKDFATGIANTVDYWTIGAGSAPILPTLRAAREDLTGKNIGSALGSGLLGIGTGATGVAAAATALSPVEIAFRAVNKADATPTQMILESAGKYLAGAQEGLRPKAKTAEGRGILSGIESTPASVASVVGGAYLRSATAGALLMGGVTGGQSFLQGRQAGLSTEAALAFGGIDAAVEFGTERLPLGELIGPHSVGSPFIKRFVRSAAEEMAGEQVATFLQDFNQWGFIESNRGKSFGDFLAERPGRAYETALATIFTTGAMNIAAEGLHRAGAIMGKQYVRASPAERDAEMLDLLGQIAAASKVAQRDPGSFEDFVQQAADGTSATDVYVDASQLAQVLEQSGLSPEQGAELTGIGIADMRLAVETGADLRIPIETYAARVAPSDLGPALLDHLRIDPEAMSRAEAKVFMQSAEVELKSLADATTTLALKSDEERASQDRVKEQILGELNKAGRFSPTVNEAYATLHAAAMANIAAREGMSAEELAQRYGLMVQSGEVAQATFDQDSEAFRNWFGDSQVRDSEGKPLVVYHGTSSDIGGEFNTTGGTWFTDSSSLAGEYAAGEKGSVFPVYISLKNPVEFVHSEQRKTIGEIISTALNGASNLSEDQIAKAKGTIAALRKRHGDEAKELFEFWRNDSKIASLFRTLGYDGIAAYERSDRKAKTWAVFEPTQIKHAQNGGAFDPNDPNIFNQAPSIEEAHAADPNSAVNRYNQDLVFYSALGRAIDAQKTAKAPGAQWIATLKKAPGVKQEELEWSGILDFLQMQESQPVTKQQLQELIEGGGIRVDEVVLGDRSAIEDRAQELYDAASEEAYREAQDNVETSHFYEEVEDEDGNTVYQVFGPYADEDSVFDSEEEAEEAVADFNTSEIEDAMQYFEFEAPYMDFEREAAEGTDVQFKDWSSDPSNDTYRELLITLPLGEGKNPARAPSTHWDTEAVVAHARFMEKTDADGAKVLFVEEVQSDWHQKGRDQGYETKDPEKIDVLHAAEKRAADALSAALTAFTGTPAVENGAFVVSHSGLQQYATEETQPFVDEVRASQLAMREARIAANSGANGIPDAPFRASWPALVMKRMIRWAVDNGYQKIAWTTGEQQAERYNLSDATGPISYRVEPDGRIRVHIANGRRGIRQQLQEMGAPAPEGGAYFTPEQAKTTFGAAITERMLAQAEPVNPSIRGEEDAGFRTLEGDGLRIGGEGMKAFYDRNLVNITNDLIKRYGAKVGKVAIEDFNLADTAAEEPVISTQPGFEITPQLAEVASQGFPLFQKTGQARGQIALAPDISQAPSVITLLRGADLSTFLHESGHFYWEVMTDLAGRPGASETVRADVQRMLDFVGVADLPTWLGMSTAEKRPAHEQIARAFEAYLFENKAPSPELRSLFGRFAQWLRAVYKQLTALNVELTAEVRGVFDRMLASDQEIADAQIDAGMAPLLDEKPEDVLVSEWAAYQREGLEATEEAVRQLAARSLRDMQYAGRAAARELKRLRRESAENRKAIKEEVDAELRAEPIYRAIRYLRTGQIDDQPKIEGENYKLHTGLVRELLSLGDDPMPTALNGMTSTDNGVNPQQIADLFGYGSADQLLHDLLFASPLAEAIDAETDNRMRERFGELSSPEALEEAVQSAIHNDVRGRFVATELAMLQKAPGKKRALGAAAAKLARDSIARMKLRNVRPGQYEAAERREGKLAIETRGDLAKATAHKRNQLLQFHLAKEAHAAREEAESIRQYLSKFDKASVRKAIDKTFLDQIDTLLEAVQLKPISDIEAQRRSTMAQWVESMREEGFEPTFDEDFLLQISKRAYRDLLVDEIRQLDEAVRNIEWLGRRTKELLTAKDKADLDTAANDVADSIRTFANRSIEEGVGSPSWWDRVKSGARDFLAQHRKFANLVYVFDGNKYGGAAWERFTRGMNEAGDRETTMNAEATRRLAAIFRTIEGMDLHTKRYEPEIGKPVSLETRLMTALNWGNSTNRARVMDGDGWTQEQVEKLLEPLTAQHWDFVEQVWTYIDSFWPETAAKQERVTGVRPEKVEAEPFQMTVGGQLRLLRGGYFPIKYDPDRSSKAEADTAAEVLTQMKRGLYTNATTRRGHTKERVDTVRGRPIRKDLGVIFGHVTQVIHDLAWHETLIDTNRLLRHGAIDSAVREHYGPEVLRWMRKALEDIATGDIPAQNAFERSINYVRAGASISAMGWSIWTSLLQPIGLTQSISRIGVKHVARGIGDLFGSPAQMNAKIEWIYSVSPFMQERARTMQREVNEIRNKVGPKSPLRLTVERVIPAPAADFVADSWFYMLGKAQLVADLPTWLGQYEKSMAAGETPDRAAAIADQAVIDSQSSGMIKDLAGVQRGSPVWKLWTSFYSYFSATYNLLVDRTAELNRKGMRDLPYFAVDVAMLTFVPATLTSIMYGVLKGGDDDDAEDWLKRIAADNLNYMLGTMIGVREIGGALTGLAGYSGPAGARVFSAVGNFGRQVAQGEVDEAMLRSANAVGGVLLHYPSAQIDKTVRGLIKYANGDAGPQAVLVGPPPKK